MSSAISNNRPKPDQVITDIADYALKFSIKSAEAYNTARLCLMDTLGCGLEALTYPACTKLMGPVVPGTIVPNGAKVPGTTYVLDPVMAAFNIGCMIRWLDFNDTWLAAEWGHPSDNLGGILATADWISRNNIAAALIGALKVRYSAFAALAGEAEFVAATIPVAAPLSFELARESRNTSPTDTGSSSTRFRTSKLATALWSGLPIW